MKIYIVENNICGYLGHFFNMALGLKENFEKIGIESSVLVNQKADADVCKKLQGKAIFPNCFWESEKEPDAVSAMHLYGKRFAEVLSTVESITGDDWLIVTTAFQDQVFGVAAYLETLSPENRPNVLFYIQWSNWRMRPDFAPAWKEACARISAISGTKSIIFAGLTEQLTQDFTQTTGCSAVVWPGPQYYGQRQPLVKRVKDKPVRISSLGRSLRRKGSHLLPEIIMRVKLSCPNACFSIQATNNMPKLKYMRFLPGVEIIEGGTTTAEHLDAIRSTEILLLPYQREDYADRSSGLMMEAAAFGRVVVVPDGTWLSDQIAEGKAAGKAFAQHSAKSIAESLILAIKELPKLSDQALKCADFWWDNQSSSAFVQKFMVLLEAQRAELDSSKLLVSSEP